MCVRALPFPFLVIECVRRLCAARPSDEDQGRVAVFRAGVPDMSSTLLWPPVTPWVMLRAAPGRVFATGKAQNERYPGMARLLMLFVLAAVSAGCRTNYATSGAPVLPGEDPYFECRATAAYFRRHQDTCTAILKG